MSATIREKHAFKQRVGGQTNFKRVVRGIVDENSLAGLYKEKKLITIYQSSAEAIVDTRLACEFSVKVNRCLERVVRRGDVMSQHGCRKFRFVSIVIMEGIRQALAVKSHVPGK